MVRSSWEGRSIPGSNPGQPSTIYSGSQTEGEGGRHIREGVAREVGKSIQRTEGDDLGLRRRGGMEEESIELRRGNEGPNLVLGDSRHGGGHRELSEDHVPGPLKA